MKIKFDFKLGRYNIVPFKEKFVIEKRYFGVFWVQIKGIRKGGTKKEVAVFDSFDEATATLLTSLVGGLDGD